jgi:hypothetical protein
MRGNENSQVLHRNRTAVPSSTKVGCSLKTIAGYIYTHHFLSHLLERRLSISLQSQEEEIFCAFISWHLLARALVENALGMFAVREAMTNKSTVATSQYEPTRDICGEFVEDVWIGPWHYRSEW